MLSKRHLCLNLALLLGVGALTTNAAAPYVLSPQQEARVEELLGKLSLEQKLGQLTQLSIGGLTGPDSERNRQAQERIFERIRAGSVGSILNLVGAEITNKLQRVAVEEGPHGIPILFAYDTIHGYRTIFPIPLAESCTWSPELIERAARIAAIESSAHGLQWTFAPMVDMSRDPRWGRIAEGAGEDPWLASIIAAARVRGFQNGDVSQPDAILACAKHYVAYGAPEGGRDYNTVDISPRTLHELHLPPFRAAIDAGVATFMTAFNEVNGIPASGHPQLINGLVRDEWGFEGFFVSDYESIEEMIDHGFVLDRKGAAIAAMNAGCDMSMVCETYLEHLGEAVREGSVKERTIDASVKRILRAKMAVALFDRPYTDVSREQTDVLTAEHREVAREVSRRSMVLLTNRDAALPLERDAKIALVGPLADAAEDMLGTWSAQGRAEDVVTVLAALRERLGADGFRYAKGCEARADDGWQVDQALAAAEASDVIVAVVGEPRNMSGEAHSRAFLDLPGRQLEFLQALEATGKPLIVVLMGGRPMSVPWSAENADAVLMAWHLGVEAGPAVVEALFGDVNPSGKLTATFPRTVGQVPIHYNYKNTGRPPTDFRYTSKYIDAPWTPLFVFGHGLSYTTFTYSDLTLSQQRIAPDGKVTVSVKVTNSGDRAGEEVAQLYIRDLVGSFTRPVRELRGFQRIRLEPGASRTLTFDLGPRELSMLDRNLQPVVEPGDFEVYVGGSSAAELMTRFTVDG